MLSISDVKKGKVIVLDNTPYLVLYSQLAKKGRAGSVLTTKLRNLSTGNILERNFKQSDTFLDADITENYAEFLYSDGVMYHFMDEKTFEQFEFTEDTIGSEKILYLTAGVKVKIISFNSEPISVELPPKVTLEVTEAAPAIKGNSVDAALKTVTTETGLTVQVPMFIKQGDKVKISTETGAYEEKVL